MGFSQLFKLEIKQERAPILHFSSTFKDINPHKIFQRQESLSRFHRRESSPAPVGREFIMELRLTSVLPHSKAFTIPTTLKQERAVHNRRNPWVLPPNQSFCCFLLLMLNFYCGSFALDPSLMPCLSPHPMGYSVCELPPPLLKHLATPILNASRYNCNRQGLFFLHH